MSPTGKINLRRKTLKIINDLEQVLESRRNKIQNVLNEIRTDAIAKTKRFVKEESGATPLPAKPQKQKSEYNQNIFQFFIGNLP